LFTVCPTRNSSRQSSKAVSKSLADPRLGRLFIRIDELWSRTKYESHVRGLLTAIAKKGSLLGYLTNPGLDCRVESARSFRVIIGLKMSSPVVFQLCVASAFDGLAKHERLYAHWMAKYVGI
jgi:hypothetical protein